MKVRFFHRPPESLAFTLLELMISIGVVAMLAGLLLPVFNKGLQAARLSACSANLRQIFFALSAYATDHENHLPPAQNDHGNYAFLHLSSYVPAEDLTIWGGNSSGKGVFCCPELKKRVGVEKAGASNNYALNSTIWQDLNPVSSHSGDAEAPIHNISRPSRTILAGDCAWYSAGGHPFSIINNYLTPGKIEGITPSNASHANGGGNILFADGHVEYWKDTSILQSDPKYSDKGPEDLWNPQKSTN